MEKNKIGLVLAFKGTNYGMHLQGYATQQILDSWGFKTEIIDYVHKGLFNGISFQRGLFSFILKTMIGRFCGKTHKYDWTELHNENNRERASKSNLFRNEMLHDIVQIVGIKALGVYAKTCQSVLIGSDQLWLPGTSFGKFLSLRFVPQNVNKISYATSLGVSQYPKYCYSSAKAMWQRIEHISTREQEGKRIINEICPELQVKVVADPTYLLTKEEWLEKIPYRKVVTDKYLLCYFLGNNENSKQCARRYADKHNLRLVSIVSNESMSDIDFTFCDEPIIGASVDDFINLIRNADCVFTDSFHGLAFSVINEKNFYVFYRKRDDAKQSRNSRIDNILRIWNLSDRLITNNDIQWAEDIVDVDYKVVTSKLRIFREDSLKWLFNALNSN